MKGRTRQILVDANGFLVACRVEPAGMSDRKAARFLTAALAPLWPRIRTVIADAGYESGALAQYLEDQAGWQLRIVKRPGPGFEIVGPNWIVERTFARASVATAGCPRTTRSASRPRRRSLPSPLAPSCLSASPPADFPHTLSYGLWLIESRGTGFPA